MGSLAISWRSPESCPGRGAHARGGERDSATRVEEGAASRPSWRSLLHYRVGIGDPPINPSQPRFEVSRRRSDVHGRSVNTRHNGCHRWPLTRTLTARSARHVESPVGGEPGRFPGPWTFACRRASIAQFASSSRKYFTRSRMRPQAWGLRHSLGDNDHAWRQGDSQGHLLRSYAPGGDRSESPWAVDGTVRRGWPLLPRDGGAAQPLSSAGRRARGPVDGGSTLGGRGAERRFMTRLARSRRLSTRRRRLA